jgi:peptide-O-fucosyltransferase
MRYFTIVFFFALNLQSDVSADEESATGYLLFCPCMGRLGNQVSHLLGAIASAKESGRTLVLPPFVKYRRGKTSFVSFDDHFTLSAVNAFVPAMTMTEFLSDQERWPKEDRRLYCQSPESNGNCPMPKGNPQKTFWDHHDIEFVETVTTIVKPTDALSIEDHPVIALASSAGSYPVKAKHRQLQQYLSWNNDIARDGDNFIRDNLTRPYLAVHLRNGDDWANACNKAVDREEFFESAQCGLHRGSGDVITREVCIPGPSTAIQNILDAQKSHGPFPTVFVGTDRKPYLEEIKAAVGETVSVVRGTSAVMDLYVFGQADIFLANCLSSFSALSVRERNVNKQPTLFLGR